MPSTRAAVLRAMAAGRPYSDSRPLGIERLRLPRPGRGAGLVRGAAAGLCHSYLSVIDGSRPRPLPMVLGREAAGVVEELGPHVSGSRGAVRVRFGCAPAAAWTAARASAAAVGLFQATIGLFTVASPIYDPAGSARL